jgi:hypothetical protein
LLAKESRHRRQGQKDNLKVLQIVVSKSKSKSNFHASLLEKCRYPFWIVVVEHMAEHKLIQNVQYSFPETLSSQLAFGDTYDHGTSFLGWGPLGLLTTSRSFQVTNRLDARMIGKPAAESTDSDTSETPW